MFAHVAVEHKERGARIFWIVSVKQDSLINEWPPLPPDVLQAVILCGSALHTCLSILLLCIINDNKTKIGIPDWYNEDDGSNWNTTLVGAVESLWEKKKSKWLHWHGNKLKVMNDLRYRSSCDQMSRLRGCTIGHTLCFCTGDVREFSRILRVYR